MKRLTVEKQLLVKELWSLPDDYDLEQPLHLQGWLLAHRSIPSSPIIIRDYREGESLEPSLEDRAKERAEIGAWRRFVRLMKGHTVDEL